MALTDDEVAALVMHLAGTAVVDLSAKSERGPTEGPVYGWVGVVVQAIMQAAD